MKVPLLMSKISMGRQLHKNTHHHKSWNKLEIVLLPTEVCNERDESSHLCYLSLHTLYYDIVSQLSRILAHHTRPSLPIHPMSRSLKQVRKKILLVDAFFSNVNYLNKKWQQNCTWVFLIYPKWITHKMNIKIKVCFP